MQVEQWGLEPALAWDVGIPGRGLSHCPTLHFVDLIFNIKGMNLEYFMLYLYLLFVFFLKKFIFDVCVVDKNARLQGL